MVLSPGKGPEPATSSPLPSLANNLWIAVSASTSNLAAATSGSSSPLRTHTVSLSRRATCSAATASAGWQCSKSEARPSKSFLRLERQTRLHLAKKGPRSSSVLPSSGQTKSTKAPNAFAGCPVQWGLGLTHAMSRSPVAGASSVANKLSILALLSTFAREYASDASMRATWSWSHVRRTLWWMLAKSSHLRRSPWACRTIVRNGMAFSCCAAALYANAPSFSCRLRCCWISKKTRFGNNPTSIGAGPPAVEPPFGLLPLTGSSVVEAGADGSNKSALRASTMANKHERNV
mmetsp:Transcript_70468/g.196103  ORF Transcript_70468/g.196103 Transcript_70468/m.196103 type:complete len:291 (-) Transcript_70468:6786-7658(-)